MTSRRTFLASLSALSSTVVLGPPRPAGAPTVRATPTVFYGRPDQSRNLVRFQISGLDAPAGRLRVYSHRQQLIGTAGVLPRGDVLEGELWMSVPRATNVVSVLEAPGVRQPLRTSHRLDPQRKWTVYLFSIVEADDIDAALSPLPPLQRGIRAAIYGKAGVTINPLPRERTELQDEHLSFLRITKHARHLGREFGVPVSRAAVIDERLELESTVISALAGSSVELVMKASVDEGLAQRWEARDTSSLLSIGSVLASPEAMGLTEASSYSNGGVEQLLREGAFASPDYETDVAVVVNRTLVTQPAELINAVDNWNSRFAYPRIVLRGTTELAERLHQQQITTNQASSAHASVGVVSLQEIGDAGARRAVAVAERSAALVDILAAQLAGSETGLEALARNIPTVVPGTIVFNSSPFPRSEFVTMTDGSPTVATQVPPLGYAFFPDLPAADAATDWEQVSEYTDLRGQTTRIRLDERSGAIVSMHLIDEPGREWVQRPSEGLNAVRGARLERRTVHRIPGAATRLVAHRRSSRHGEFTSTITLYDDLPWIDIENGGPPSSEQAIDYAFALAVETPDLVWEIPAGIHESAAPDSTIRHLRWIRLADAGTGQQAFLLRGLDAPYATVDGGGRLTSHAPPGLSRYRIALTTESRQSDAAWRFGWSAEPLGLARVERKATGALPRFGSIISVSQPGAAVLGLKEADNGDGMIVFVQELFGEARRVRVRSGLVRFGAAQMVDYLEQDRGDSLPIERDETTLDLTPHGIAAVRLSQVTLAGT